MFENRELNLEQLEKVAGGSDDSWAVDHMKYLPAGNYEHVGKDYVYRCVGSKFYAVNDTDVQAYCRGQLVSSNGSVHTLTVESIHDHCIHLATGYQFVNVRVGDTISVSANSFTMFLIK